jgi:DNA-directed RNA polymerase subunit RPC12/RpoP
MKILKCIVCDGEIDIINEDNSIFKKVKCRKCGFTNLVPKKETKYPEIIIRRKLV